MSKRKLLLADDSVTIQKVVNLTFADEGIEVITASDGNAAMEKLRENEPDLVMADVNMPGLNGYQICEQIKSDAARRQTPVILLVGSFEPFDEARAQAVGANDYLTKPFQSIRQLVNKVTELLAVDQAGKEAELTGDTLEMEKPDLSDRALFDDAAMDDGMIQTDHIDNYSSFDMPGFSGRTAAAAAGAVENGTATESFDAAYENAADNAPETTFEPVGEKDDYRVAEEEIVRTEKRYLESFEQSYTGSYEEAAETEENDFSPEPVEELPAAADDYFSSAAAPSYADENEQILEEPEQKMTAFQQENRNETADEIPQPMSASVLELDEFNLLDLPPFDFEETEEAEENTASAESESQPAGIEDSPSPAATVEQPIEPTSVEVSGENETQSEINRQLSALNFPPEVIEAIADRVVEKLSQKLKQ